MLRTALIRSAGVARRTLRPSSVATIRRLAAPSVPSAVPSFALRAAGWAAVRSYSSGSGLKKEEVEGRIMALLHNFDKVRRPGSTRVSIVSSRSHIYGLSGILRMLRVAPSCRLLRFPSSLDKPGPC